MSGCELDEQLEDILAPRELVESTQPDDIGVSVAYPLPGTRFHEIVKEQLTKKTNWRESDDLDMMFEGTYSSIFYRAVRDLLHAQVAIHAGNGSCATSEQREAARAALEHRWHRLLSREREYRLDPDEMRGAI